MQILADLNTQYARLSWQRLEISQFFLSNGLHHLIDETSRPDANSLKVLKKPID